MDSSIIALWTSVFQMAGCLVSFFYYHCLIDILVCNANRVEPDQMLHSAASDLGLHCLPITLSRLSRLKWVNIK